MEEIIQILIFVGAMAIAVVGQNAKNKKKPTSASPQEVLEDVFPDIELQDTTPEEPQKTMRPAIRRAASPKPTHPHPPKKTMPSPPVEDAKKIRIHTREEARRAFIHSEIFNRKY